MHRKMIYIITILGFLSCVEIQEHYLRSPDAIYPLKKVLTEISGLVYQSPEKLMAVQDEKGTIYSLPIAGFKKFPKIEFAKDGDYEGITATDKHYYILKSNGNITRVDLDGSDKKVYKPKHNKKLEYEGLCYDAQRNRLLILCKDDPNKEDNHFIQVFGFDIGKKKFGKKPVLKIDKTEAGIYRPKGLLPSGIAINPVDNYIYILSSVGKKLIVCNAQAELIHYYNLDSSVYKQPEGITFSPTGELFIASEGKSGKAEVLYFKSIP